jgi:anion-transporting  ArsA/GET3 family ATPase
VLLTGKTKECVTRTERGGGYVYDAVVMDAPPTGRVVTFLNVTVAMADLARRGPIHAQAEGVAALLHSADTAVHLVTLLQDMPVAETVEAIEHLRAANLPVGTIIVNAATHSPLPDDTLEPAALGDLDREALATSIGTAVKASAQVVEGLVGEAQLHAATVVAERECADTVYQQRMPVLTLPYLVDGADLGGVYELADHLHEQGV